MSGIEIRSGGVVAVDSSSLYRAAHALDRIEQEISDAALQARTGGWILGRVAGALVDGSPGEAARIGDELVDAAEDCRGLAAALRSSAATYEYVELIAARAMAGDARELAAVDARLAALRDAHPAEAMLAMRGLQHDGKGEALAGQWMAAAAMFGPTGMLIAGGFAALFRGAVAGVGRGRVPRGEHLVGPPVPVVVRPVRRSSGSAPASLEEATTRIPGGGAARVRVERYSMPDGSREFAVYITGTQSGDREVFDWAADLDGYSGRRTGSYDAVLEALRQSGAEPGDVVHEFGHSQGGMIASRVATDSDFDVRTVVTFGSPIEAALPDTTLSVAVRHTDEVVQALADGGSPARVGAPGSFIVERVADPLPQPLPDLLQSSHALTAYAETAAMLDASDDVRMDGMRGVLADLERATSVDVVEYSATRPEAG